MYGSPSHRYTTSTDQTICTGIECVAGKYGPGAQISSGAATCTHCAAGTFTSATGTVTCGDKALKKCGAGQAYTEGTASADDSSCANCAPGRWNNASDTSACALKSVQTCSAGEAYTEGTSAANDASCADCVTGKWNNADDTTGCVDKTPAACAVGTGYTEGTSTTVSHNLVVVRGVHRAASYCCDVCVPQPKSITADVPQ